jgi:thiaminase/transcriptional activator TenA
MLHEELWHANHDLVQACLRHPFVRSLAEATLAPELFRNYVAQDAFFLNAFAKAYRLAQAVTTDSGIAAFFSELIAGVQDELKLHRAYAAQLGIDLEGVTPNAACRAYTEFLMRAAERASLGEIVASLVPCMSLYAYLGTEMRPMWSPQHPYRKWIETYSGEEFSVLAQRLESVLDRVAAGTPQVQRAYRDALQCELAFFSAFVEG